MPVYKSTTEAFIMGRSTYHATLIEQATSQQQLIQADSCEQLRPHICHKPSEVSAPNRIACPERTNRTPNNNNNNSNNSRNSSGRNKAPYVRRRSCGQLDTSGSKFSIRDPLGTCPAARRALKNLLVLGVSFMFLFSGFLSLQTLQSSLNRHHGLTSLTCVYAATVLSSCFLAPLTIGKLSTKWTVVLGQTAFLVYFLAHLVPGGLALLVVCSLILGLATGPMWSAQATYLTTLAIQYAQLASTTDDHWPNQERLALKENLLKEDSLKEDPLKEGCAVQKDSLKEEPQLAAENVPNEELPLTDTAKDRVVKGTSVPHDQVLASERTCLNLQRLLTEKPFLSHELVVNKFNGIFCAVLQTSQVWANLLSSGLLSSPYYSSYPDNHTTSGDHRNGSVFGADCGARDCSARGYFPPEVGTPFHHHFGHVTSSGRHILFGAQAACALAAILLTSLCLDRNDTNVLWTCSASQLVMSTLRTLKDSRLQALIPLVLYTGIEQAFVMADFTKSYVNCALGIEQIGYVMACFGAVNALTSISIGQIGRHIRRHVIVLAGSLFNACLLMALLWWLPSDEDMAMFYVISGCLGLCDAIWQTQTNTLFGVLFSNNQEAAFANYRMCQATGFAVAFAYSHVFCVRTKLFIMAAVLIVALVFYGAVEYKTQQGKRLKQGIVIL